MQANGLDYEFYLFLVFASESELFTCKVCNDTDGWSVGSMDGCLGVGKDKQQQKQRLRCTENIVVSNLASSGLHKTTFRYKVRSCEQTLHLLPV